MDQSRRELFGALKFTCAIFGIPRWQIIEKTLLVAVLLDLALGGNGYLIHIFGLRLREIFYVLCLVWVVLRLTYIQPIRLDKNLSWLSVAFFTVTALDAILGYCNGNRVRAIIAEIKPLSYFPMLFFFLVAIRTRRDLTLVASILVACGMLLALLYLLVLLLVGAGFINGLALPSFLQQSDEFIFRRVPFVGFFYKGFFYICVAAIFVLFDPFRWTKVLGAVAVVAVAMTLTRGLGIAVIASILAGIALNRNWTRAPLLIGQGALLLTVLFVAEKVEIESSRLPSDQVVTARETDGYSALQPASPAAVGSPADPSASEAARPDKSEGAASDQNRRPMLPSMLRLGDYQRMDDLKFILSRLDLSMVILGRGLGAPIAGRDRIEITYPEMLYKQGLPGLLVWFLLALYTFYLYLKVPTETKQFGLAFLLSSLFVFVATASNTLLTGSIGMAVVFISLASLLVLSHEERAIMHSTDWYGV